MEVLLRHECRKLKISRELFPNLAQVNTKREFHYYQIYSSYHTAERFEISQSAAHSEEPFVPLDEPKLAQ